MRYAHENAEQKRAHLLPLRERLIAEMSRIDGARLNGDRERRLASNVNFSFAGIEGETLVLQLDLLGIAVSSGSACTSGSLDPSHVLTAIGASHDEARGSIRVSMSEYTTESDIDAFLSALDTALGKLRR